jgi:hypothetical protein
MYWIDRLNNEKNGTTKTIALLVVLTLIALS